MLRISRALRLPCAAHALACLLQHQYFLSKMKDDGADHTTWVFLLFQNISSTALSCAPHACKCGTEGRVRLVARL